MGKRAIRRMRAYVDDWAKTHKPTWRAMDQGQSRHAATARPRTWRCCSSRISPRTIRGKFPSPVTSRCQDGKSETAIEPVQGRHRISSRTFSICGARIMPMRTSQDVPGDMVTASGSGLDPHITLDNAEYQLDRVASKWAADTKRDPAKVRQQIEADPAGEGLRAVGRSGRREDDQRARGQPRTPPTLRRPCLSVRIGTKQMGELSGLQLAPAFLPIRASLFSSYDAGFKAGSQKPDKPILVTRAECVRRINRGE